MPAAAPIMAEIAARWIDDGTADAAIQANQEEARVRTALAREILGWKPTHSLEEGIRLTVAALDR